jgi:hypothetical protein
LKRKEETKNKTESAAGNTNSSANKLVILNKEEDRVEEVVSSPIPQVDGPIDKEQLMKFEFVSNYAEEDIEYSLEEIFPDFKTVYATK